MAVTWTSYAILGIGITAALVALVAAGFFNALLPPPPPAYLPQLPAADISQYKVYMIARSVHAHEILVELMKVGLPGSNIEYYMPANVTDTKSIVLYDSGSRPSIDGYPIYFGIQDVGSYEGIKVYPPNSVF